MAEVTIPKEKMNYTIDLFITMVTEEIGEETGKDRKEVLTDFLCSRTGISKIGLTENIEKRIIITRGGISHTNACVGGVVNGSNERLCCPSG